MNLPDTSNSTLTSRSFFLNHEIEGLNLSHFETNNTPGNKQSSNDIYMSTGCVNNQAMARNQDLLLNMGSSQNNQNSERITDQKYDLHSFSVDMKYAMYLNFIRINS